MKLVLIILTLSAFCFAGYEDRCKSDAKELLKSLAEITRESSPYPKTKNAEIIIKGALKDITREADIASPTEATYRGSIQFIFDKVSDFELTYDARYSFSGGDCVLTSLDKR